MYHAITCKLKNNSLLINTVLSIIFRQLILRDCIDVAFEGVMDAVNLPVPVRYFLCMLDKQGKDIHHGR
jgi:hypothetical protein